jgi:hypothetical protein
MHRLHDLAVLSCSPDSLDSFDKRTFGSGLVQVLRSLYGVLHTSVVKHGKKKGGRGVAARNLFPWSLQPWWQGSDLSSEYFPRLPPVRKEEEASR